MNEEQDTPSEEGQDQYAETFFKIKDLVEKIEKNKVKTGAL